MDYDPLEAAKEFISGAFGAIIGVLGIAVIIYIIWNVITNFESIMQEIIIAYAQLWVIAIILLPVWVIWLIAKK